MNRAAFIAALVLPVQVGALELPTGAKRASEEFIPLASYAVPAAPWADGDLPTLEAEGRFIREAWQIPGQKTTLQLLEPLRSQLSDDGYEIVFECETDACGGFDFRFETEVIPEPDMHVNLADYRFLAARTEHEEGPEYITLLVSRTDATGYIQFIKITPAPPGPPEENLASKTPTDLGATAGELPEALPSGDIAADLEARGRAILPDLSFETGSSRLANEDFASLNTLAEYLRTHPDRKVTLVGHTDAAGSLDANVALSRARARAVLEKLVNDYDIPAAQLDANGIGYLMPLSSNLTDEGRATNRRVEVVMTSTE